MVKRYKVELSEGEQSQLSHLIKKGSRSARTIARAHILLLAHEGVHDPAIAAALHVGTATVERVRKRYVVDGLERALSELPRPGAPPGPVPACVTASSWLRPFAEEMCHASAIPFARPIG